MIEDNELYFIQNQIDLLRKAIVQIHLQTTKNKLKIESIEHELKGRLIL